MTRSVCTCFECGNKTDAAFYLAYGLLRHPKNDWYTVTANPTVLCTSDLVNLGDTIQTQARDLESVLGLAIHSYARAISMKGSRVLPTSYWKYINYKDAKRLLPTTTLEVFREPIWRNFHNGRFYAAEWAQEVWDRAINGLIQLPFGQNV